MTMESSLSWRPNCDWKSVSSGPHNRYCGAYSIIEVRTSTDCDAIIHNAKLRMDIELLLYEILLLSFRITFPHLIRHLPTVQHGVFRNRINTSGTLLQSSLISLRFKFPLLVDDILSANVGRHVHSLPFAIFFLHLRLCRMKTRAHDFFSVGAL